MEIQELAEATACAVHERLLVLWPEVEWEVSADTRLDGLRGGVRVSWWDGPSEETVRKRLGALASVQVVLSTPVGESVGRWSVLDLDRGMSVRGIVGELEKDAQEFGWAVRPAAWEWRGRLPTREEVQVLSRRYVYARLQSGELAADEAAVWDQVDRVTERVGEGCGGSMTGRSEVLARLAEDLGVEGVAEVVLYAVSGGWSLAGLMAETRAAGEGA